MLKVAECEPTQSAIPACLAEIGAKPDGIVVVLHRLVPVTLARESHPDVVPGVGRARPHARCRSEPHQGIVESTHVGEGNTEVHLGIERIGVELKRPAVIFDRPFRPALVPEDHSQVIENPEVMLLELVGSEVIGHGLWRASLFPDRSAQIVKDIGVFGLELKGLAQLCLGFSETSLL